MKNIINKISHLSFRTRLYSIGNDAGSSSLFLLLIFLFSSSFVLAFYAPTSGPTSLNGAFTLDSTLSNLNFSSGSNNGSFSLQKTGSVNNKLTFISNSGSFGTQADNQALNFKNSSGTTLVTALKNGASINLFTVTGDLVFTQDLYQNATKLEFPWDRGTSDYTTASNIAPINGITDKVSIGGTNPANNFIFEIKNPLAQALDTKSLTFKSGSNPLIYATPTRIWGEGRDSAANLLNNANGETIISGLRISKSKRLARCDNPAAACPMGWWVCRMTNEKAANEIKDSSASTASTSSNNYFVTYGTFTGNNIYKTRINASAPTTGQIIFDPNSTADDYVCNLTTNGNSGSFSQLVYGSLRSVWCCTRTSNF